MSEVKDADTRERILDAAARLLSESGTEAVSTRAVCTAARVGAPTLYHHFGDKQGLFDAVAARAFEEYLVAKRSQASTGDPVEDLRRGWDLHAEFGRTHPAFYTLMYGKDHRSRAALESLDILTGLVERVARAGRLRVPVPMAVRMISAAGVGATLAMISEPEGGLELSQRTREAILAAITGERPDGGEAPLAAQALALRAALEADRPEALTATEAALLGEWLERLAAR
ncbi:TetR/AcrR family transcriptional regulator [Actinomadura barringtoniae]|uniref:TetR/AcrR family transcriptional regulator n=1 Tax=Actinomadura barringtoniae TaxID=1427535 RepID=A0A939PPA6_9ACTN|nr:TetR/AcrR family transcriptional regulator [Actinomadura barringtoniae]MBO2453723.1 TetR/AcrR family transcriptional regulator [Actinomadura barringtoniae]